MPHQTAFDARYCGFRFTYTPGQETSALYASAFERAYSAYQARPYAFPQRLFECGLYLAFMLGAMLQSNEFTPSRVYTLFRAQHNGFYGKNRPYRREK